MSTQKKKYDAAIIGSGLAGLTLALQLLKQRPSIKIVLIEKRKDKAPKTTHKVGESIVELGAHYLRKDLGLKNYLTTNHLPKYGFRYFLNSDKKEYITKRVEVGSKTRRQAPSHHIDRGIFENDLIEEIDKYDVDLLLDTSIVDVEIATNEKRITVDLSGNQIDILSRWLIDATGRRGFLKRKLNLKKEIDHQVNAVWFRIDKEIDIQNWSDDQQWKGELGPDFRRLSTNHFVGKGYWVWIIPLPNDKTSIGIVASEEAHPFNTINSFEKSLNWLKVNEPLIFNNIHRFEDAVLDFKVLKNYAFDCTSFFSTEKWCLSGESGVFLDPFYSPGTDFIALSNTWISDLIIRDLNNEDITFRVNLYEHTQRQLIDGWFSLYKDLYSYIDNSQVMLAKIIWDWSTYWSIITPIFIHKGFTDTDLMKSYASSKDRIGQRFDALNSNIQKIFKQWSELPQKQLKPHYINVFDIEYLYQFHLELQDRLEISELKSRLKENLHTLEIVACEIFRHAYGAKHDKLITESIDPYNMDLNIEDSWSKGSNLIESNQEIRDDLKTIFPEQEGQHSTSANSVVTNQKEVENVFQRTRLIYDQSKSFEDLLSSLEQFPANFKSVAYESASFCVGLEALEKNDLNLWFTFEKAAPEIYWHHISIGLGWAFASLNIDPKKYHGLLSSELIKMIADGYGYYNALFKQRKTIKQHYIPEYLETEELISPYYQGVGRRVWYQVQGIPNEANKLISGFPEDNRADLWLGLGLACGFVGGLSNETLTELIDISDEYHLNFSSGIVTSSMFNLNDNRNISESLGICSNFLGEFNVEDENIRSRVIGNNKKSTEALTKKVEDIINRK